MMQSKFLNVSDLPLTTRCSTGEEPHLPPGVRTGAPGFLPRPKHQRRPDAPQSRSRHHHFRAHPVLGLNPERSGAERPFCVAPRSLRRRPHPPTLSSHPAPNTWRSRSAMALIGGTSTVSNCLAALALIVADNIVDLLPHASIASWTAFSSEALLGRVDLLRAVS